MQVPLVGTAAAADDIQGRKSIRHVTHLHTQFDGVAILEMPE